MTKDEARDLWARHHETCPTCLSFKGQNVEFFCPTRVYLYEDLQRQLTSPRS